MKKNVYIVGGGITGCSLAYFLKKDFSVTLFEKSNSLGGLVRTFENLENIPYQKGSSIIHTSKDWIVDFLKQFIPLQPIDYSVAINPLIDFQYYSFPFTKSDLKRMPWHWKESINLELESIDGVKGSNLKQTIENYYGSTIFDIFYKGYISKWFGVEAEEIDSILWFSKFLKPIIENYSYYSNPTYFPINVGYNQLFKKLTEGVNVQLNSPIDYSKFSKTDLILLTTRPDHFFNQLSIDYVSSTFDIDSVVYSENKPDTIIYPNHTPFISMTQFGKMFPDRLYDNKNVMVKQFTNDGSEETHPIPIKSNINQINNIKEKYPHIYFVGWQANYTFLDIAKSIDQASSVAAKIKHKMHI